MDAKGEDCPVPASHRPRRDVLFYLVNFTVLRVHVYRAGLLIHVDNLHLVHDAAIILAHMDFDRFPSNGLLGRLDGIDHANPGTGAEFLVAFEQCPSRSHRSA